MASTWGEGYQVDTAYTYGYYQTLSPDYQRFCLLLHGVDTPDVGEDGVHCELGFGQGVSINVHAAASASPFHGNDFNPAHVAHARQLARHSGIDQHLYEDSFKELLARDDLPQFDSIGLHGIWSWINHENQHYILQFIRRYLKSGGVVYNSYNCTTGWAPDMPVRDLLYGQFKFNSHGADPEARVPAVLDFCERLLKMDMPYTRRDPQAVKKVQGLRKHEASYVIHEYLNDAWRCYPFQQMADTFADIKLSFGGTADAASNLDRVNISAEGQAFLASIEHPLFREQCRDYFLGTQFRRDLYVRGINRLTRSEMTERLRATAFVLLVSPANMPKKINGHLGSFDLLGDIYDAMARAYTKEAYRPLTIAELVEATDIDYGKVVDAMLVLFQLNAVQPCRARPPSQTVLKQCHQLNRHILDQASHHMRYRVLASPVTGIGMGVGYIDLLLFRAHIVGGIEDAGTCAQYVLDVLDARGQRVVNKEGKPVDDKAESLAMLTGHAREFADNARLDVAAQLRLFQ